MQNNLIHLLLRISMAGLLTCSIRAAEVLTPGFLKLAIYPNIAGSTVTDLTADPNYPAAPAEVRFLRDFNSRDAAPTDVLENFGGRIEGFLTPLESGDYHFFLRSQRASELWLGTGETEASASVIAQETDNGDAFMEPDAGDAATSAAIPLVAGQRYFIMVIYKGAGGAGTSTDYAQVAWRSTSNTGPAAQLRPISRAFLSTLASDAAKPAITISQQPSDTLRAEANSLATFTVAAITVTAEPLNIQWQRNGINLPGANGPEYTRYLDQADNGAKFRAVVSVPGASLMSAESASTVTADTMRPMLVRAKGSPNRPEVQLIFSERVKAASATTTTNYVIASSNGTPLAVTGATLSADATGVMLATDAQTPGTEYTVTVSNLVDLALPTPNLLQQGSQVKFTARGPWFQGEDGFVVWEAEDFDRNLDGLWFPETERGTASGGVAMVVNNGAGGSENSTKIEYDIQFTRTGTHYLWYRNSANDGNDDSAWLHIDGARPPEREAGNQAALSGFTSALAANYGWASAAFEGGGNRLSFAINTAGLHSVGIARREDGTYLDKFVITSDPNFNPTTGFGIFGPGVTLRQGDPPPASADFEITQHPTDTTGKENASISLTAAASIPPEFLFTYQWQRKQGNTFADIPGATLPTFTLNPLTSEWDAAIVRMRVTVSGIAKFSNTATITVISDRTPPELLRITALASSRTVFILFSEPVTPTTANAAPNYKIEGPAGLVAVNSAVVMPNGRTVVLVTGPQTVGTKYQLTVSNVGDTAVVPNAIINGRAKFYSLGALLPQGADGLMVIEAESFDRNLDNLWTVDLLRATPSGGASAVNYNGAGGSETATKIEFDLTFTQTGPHILWYRASCDSGTDDSIWLHVNGARPPNRVAANQASITGFNGQLDFVWRSNPQDGGGQMTFDIPVTGVHAIGFARREDGAFLDKFLITTDASFRPDNYGSFGPPETRLGAPERLPAITITSPTPNAEFTAGSAIPIAIDIGATTRILTKVEYFNGATRIGESTTPPFNFLWSNPPQGSHSLTARLVDDVLDTILSKAVVISAVNPPEQMTVTVALGANGLNLSWTGGTPPYTVQKNATLAESQWKSVLTTNETSATVPIDGISGFFRIASP